MKTFDYRGLDLQGRTRKGLVEALNVKDAREKLAKSGVFADRVAPAGEHHHKSRFKRKQGFSLDRRAIVYRELGALLKAGVPIVRALEILIESPEMGEARGLLARARDDIREGSSLAEAISRASPAVVVLEKALITVGERSGTLGEALDGLASFLEEQQTVKDRVRTAMLYPAIVIAVAMVISAGVFVFVLPQTEKMLTEMRIELPLITRVMTTIGKILTIWGLPAAVVIAVVIIAIRRKTLADPVAKRDMDRRMLSMPVVGRCAVILANLRFARTLSVLLHGGVPLVEGLQLAGKATGNTWIEHLTGEASESVRHGGSLSDVVRAIPPLSETLPGWIQAGEASGNLEGLLINASDRYQRQWMRFMARSLGLLEPAIILVLGVFVLLVALSVLLPIISANQIIK